eukprot:609087-Rhodomonas_salina.2
MPGNDTAYGCEVARELRWAGVGESGQFFGSTSGRMGTCPVVISLNGGQCDKLKNVDGVMGKSDPRCDVYRKVSTFASSVPPSFGLLSSPPLCALSALSH